MEGAPRNEAEKVKQEFIRELAETKKLLEASPAVQAFKRLDNFFKKVDLSKLDDKSLQSENDQVFTIRRALIEHPDIRLWATLQEKNIGTK